MRVDVDGECDAKWIALIERGSNKSGRLGLGPIYHKREKDSILRNSLIEFSMDLRHEPVSNE